MISVAVLSTNIAGVFSALFDADHNSDNHVFLGASLALIVIIITLTR